MEKNTKFLVGMKTSVGALENRLAVPRKVTCRVTTWTGNSTPRNTYTRKCKHTSTQNPVREPSEKRPLFIMTGNWKQPNIHPPMTKQRKCGPSTQWNITKAQKRIKYRHRPQSGGTLKMPRHVKEASHRRPRIVWFRLCEMSGTGESITTEILGCSGLGDAGEGGVGRCGLMGTHFLSEVVRMF